MELFAKEDTMMKVISMLQEGLHLNSRIQFVFDRNI